jgi:hypothetical protein
VTGAPQPSLSGQRRGNAVEPVVTVRDLALARDLKRVQPRDLRPGQRQFRRRRVLLIAIRAGVVLDRMLLGHTELNRPGTEDLIPYLQAALDAVAKAPESAPGG